MAGAKQGDDWCMRQPMRVDTLGGIVLSSKVATRCPACKRRLNLKQYDYAPYGTKYDPVWYWPEHKIRKTKR